MEMAMAHSLGLALHCRDGAAPKSRFCPLLPASSRLFPKYPMVLSPRPSLTVHARLQKSQIRTSEQGQIAGASNEFQTLSAPATNTLPPAQPTYIGSPLLWVGVGVGISVLFSWAANYAKKQAMQQALKTMMGGNGSNQFGNIPYPFPIPPQAPTSTTSTSRVPPASTPSPVSTSTVVEEATVVTENNKPVFTEVEVQAETATVKPNAEESQTQQKEENPVFFKDTEIKDTGAGFNWTSEGSTSTSTDGKTGSFFSVDTLEKMLEDPTVQQMVYPYLPEEMRNPSTFKWMMQNPQFRTQLQEMLNNMTEDGSWKNGQMADLLKNFNPNNPELKEQFEQIGLSPEEVMAKMVENPDIAMAFQNPKIQAALFDCSQNPANITKYQNDKEVMDVFNKIAELFPMKGF